MINKSIVVGLSGGVDSSVAALLLKQQGFSLQGIFMKNWEADDSDDYCAAEQDMRDAHSIADVLDIPFTVINFSQEYWELVFSNFLSEYQAGRTPNPDILCNKEIKFKAFLDYVLATGAAGIATGHYARRLTRDGMQYLLRGLDINKDQSYFLYALNQFQLAHSYFPVGELIKPDVRKLAADAGFVTHAKKDSTGICFIGERKFKAFLSQYLPAQPGEMRTPEGKKVGQHHGLMYYTLGQRQGLNIGGQKGAIEAPWFVLAKDLANNILIVGQGHDHPLLYAQELYCAPIHWIAEEPPISQQGLTAKIRYRQADQACAFEIVGDKVRVHFDKPQWAITPGQSIVFYQDEICLGGAVIL